jgi:hypothetical protein
MSKFSSIWILYNIFIWRLYYQGEIRVKALVVVNIDFRISRTKNVKEGTKTDIVKWIILVYIQFL